MEVAVTDWGPTAMLAQGAYITPTGLRMASTLTFDEWRAVGERLQLVGQSIQFAIGDWLNFGDDRYEGYSQAAELTGYKPQTLQNFKWVAGKVDLSRRREGVHWAIHAEVAGLAPNEQGYWLDCAQKEQWTIKQMRDAIHPDLDTAFQMMECPECGHRWEAM